MYGTIKASQQWGFGSCRDVARWGGEVYIGTWRREWCRGGQAERNIDLPLRDAMRSRWPCEEGAREINAVTFFFFFLFSTGTPLQLSLNWKPEGKEALLWQGAGKRSIDSISGEVRKFLAQFALLDNFELSTEKLLEGMEFSLECWINHVTGKQTH